MLENMQHFKQGEEMLEGQYFQLDDISEIEPFFWLACVYCFFANISIICAIIMMPKMLVKAFGYTTFQAGFVFTIPYTISALVSPAIGWYIDHHGQRMTVSLVGSFLIFIAHILILLDLTLYSDVILGTSIIAPMLLGLGYSTYAVVIWGAIPFMVKGHTIGTAFGIATTFQNIGLVVAPPMIGYIIDNTKWAQGFGGV
jgi:MFS family permease